MRISRKKFLQIASALGAGMLLPLRWRLPRALAQIPGGTLDPTDIPKYVTPLVKPPAMPKTSRQGIPRNIDYYEIAVRQFRQPILPTGFNTTTVWSYGSANHPNTFNYPAFTIEAEFNRAVRVKWINGLVDNNGNFLPHIVPVDQTLHWANPPGGTKGRDIRPDFSSTGTPDPYIGPVPITTHLHGGNSTQESDGYAEAWYLPAANNIPSGFVTEGTWYAPFKARFEAAFGQVWDRGTAVFQYDNNQRAATLWYHDHTLGMTRLNVYAGPAGFYLLRSGPGDLPVPVLPGPAPGVSADPFATFYEIPIAIQDRSFNDDGSLFYPDSRTFFSDYDGSFGFIPDTDIPPIWNPEFFGNTMVVNGRTWPYLNVEQRRYRFRFLNGCNSRFLVLQFPDTRVDVWQIGAEGGFLPAPVRLNDFPADGVQDGTAKLLIAPAERADVIVDFTNAPVGTEIILRNLGPDEPFGGFPTPASDPDTTGQVMQFRVVARAGRDISQDPARLTLPAFRPLRAATNTRQVSLNEAVSTVGDFPIAAQLGTLTNTTANPLGWDDAITENPALNSIEIWEMYNFTEDAHPIHIHEVQFEVVNRQPFTGVVRGPEPWETGHKDTVIAYPGEITRVRALFDRPGLYVWHCHIVEHEDNEMMRPYFVGTIPPGAP